MSTSNHCWISSPPEDDQVVDGLRRSKVEQSGRPEAPEDRFNMSLHLVDGIADSVEARHDCRVQGQLSLLAD
jgi:hypothetical protein